MIGDGVRFQVSLPTPLAPVQTFVAPEDRGIVEVAYEAAMMAELGRIVDAIPHERLAIQWDVAAERGLLEHMWPPHFGDGKCGLEAGILIYPPTCDPTAPYLAVPTLTAWAGAGRTR